jgi:hypothetical protein
MYVDLHYHARQLMNISVDYNTTDSCKSTRAAGIPIVIRGRPLVSNKPLHLHSPLPFHYGTVSARLGVSKRFGSTLT